MRAIFISYRREDAEGQAGRLFDDLTRAFGEESVFMDVAGLEPGRDFRRAIDQQVSSCCVLLAMIGKNWIDAKAESGQRRLDDAADFVRLETASALKRDIPVLPVLVQGAQMPRANQLPPDLAELAYRNGVELTHARWDSDVRVLIQALTPYVELSHKDPSPASMGSPAGVSAPVAAKTASSVPSGRRTLNAVSIGVAALIAIAVAGGFARPGARSTATNDRVELAALPVRTPEPTVPPADAPIKKRPSSRQFSLVGVWAGNAPCQVVFSKDDGKDIRGHCDTSTVQHEVTGTYDDSTNVSITITRTDLGSRCATAVLGTIQIIGSNRIEMGQNGWNGCGVTTGPVTTLLSRS